VVWPHAKSIQYSKYRGTGLLSFLFHGTKRGSYLKVRCAENADRYELQMLSDCLNHENMQYCSLLYKTWNSQWTKHGNLHLT
jgi:hypothetical protein